MTSVLVSTPLFAAEQPEFDFSGNIGLELRLFPEDPQYPGQNEYDNGSIAFEPEFVWDWSDDSIIFKPYFRSDQHDSERTHFDIRELEWIHVADDWELHAGISKVFWGVTEFQHLADVINQTDGVDNIDGEDKLGQPMVYLSAVRDWGYLDVFVLPGFRERTFPGWNGRFRSELVVDTDRARFESGAEQKHWDFAVRWSDSIGDIDLSAYYFKGTNRDPILQVENRVDGAVLIPFYEQMEQVGFTGQAIVGDWLWKLETIYRDASSDQFFAAQGGYEYTLYGVRDTNTDVGLLMEYGWDERGRSGGNFQNDFTVGARFALNDEQSTEILAGFSYDFHHNSNGLVVEANRRFSDDWKLALEARTFNADHQDDPSYSIRKDDYVAFIAEWYF